jgi:hypothetical protein
MYDYPIVNFMPVLYAFFFFLTMEEKTNGTRKENRVKAHHPNEPQPTTFKHVKGRFMHAKKGMK